MPNARRLACVGVLTVVFAANGSALADGCAGQDSQPALLALSVCDADFSAFETNGVLLQEDLIRPASASKRQSASMPWIAESAAGVPLAISSADGGVTARASLDTVRDFNSRAATMSFKSASDSDSLKLPKPPAARSVPVDVWSSFTLQGYDQQRESFADTATDETVRAGAGIDYRISKAAKVGISAERGDTRSATSISPVQQDDKMAAYVTLQAAPAISLDARTEWQEGNAAFAEATGAAQKNVVSVTPRLDHTFALDGGNTLQPFISYKTVYDLNEKSIDGTAMNAALTQSAAAGVTLAKPDAYSLSVSTDVGGLNASTAPSVNGKLELKLPVN